MVVSAKNGSIEAVAGSGIRHMSDSLMAFQPAIEEPSNIWPSAKVSSSIMETSNVTCCHLPRGSVNRKSTYLTSLSLIIFMTFLAVVIACIPPCYGHGSCVCDPRLDRIHPGLSGSDPDRFLDIGYENLPVADAAGLGRAADRLDGFFRHVVGEHNFNLHFGQEIHDVFSAAVEFRVAFLTAETLGLCDRNAL